MHVPSDHKRSVRTTPECKSAAKSCLLNAGLVLVCSSNSPPAPLKTTILCPSPEHATSVRAHTPKHNFLAKSHCYLGGTHTHVQVLSTWGQVLQLAESTRGTKQASVP